MMCITGNEFKFKKNYAQAEHICSEIEVVFTISMFAVFIIQPVDIGFN